MRFPTLSLSLFALLSATATATAQDPPCDDAKLLAALAGTYQLINDSTTINGHTFRTPEFGEHPVGILLYYAHGWMSATISTTDEQFRPNLTWPPDPSRDADWAKIATHMLAYTGPLSISPELPATEASGQVYHGPIEVSSVPAWVGQRQARNYTVVDQDGTRYLGIKTDRGGGNVGTIWWKKIL